MFYDLTLLISGNENNINIKVFLHSINKSRISKSETYPSSPSWAPEGKYNNLLSWNHPVPVWSVVTTPVVQAQVARVKPGLAMLPRLLCTLLWLVAFWWWFWLPQMVNVTELLEHQVTTRRPVMPSMCLKWAVSRETLKVTAGDILKNLGYSAWSALNLVPQLLHWENEILAYKQWCPGRGYSQPAAGARSRVERSRQKGSGVEKEAWRPWTKTSASLRLSPAVLARLRHPYLSLGDRIGNF